MKHTRIALISILMALEVVGKGTPPIPPSEPLKTCSSALHACITLSRAQDAEISQLKQDKSQLAQALTQATKAPWLPTWAWVTLGVLAGTVIGAKVLK